jgi:uncharacterized membrane protein
MMRALVIALAAIAIACVSTAAPIAPAPPSAPTCARPAATCDAAVSYDDVASILRTRCLGCHARGGDAEEHDLSTQVTLRAHASAVRARVTACAMPPRGVPALTDDEATAVLRWIACAAP